jgi:hypothetical protein
MGWVCGLDVENKKHVQNFVGHFSENGLLKN